MKPFAHAAVLLLTAGSVLLAPASLCAQQPASGEHHHSDYDSWSSDSGHSFLFHQGDETAMQSGRSGEHGEGSAERHYAETHAGTYVLFTDGGQLRRLDNPKAMAEIASYQAKMKPLEAQQRALGAQQQPLSARMKALGAEMKATHDSTQMSEIGTRMSDLGKQMSALGEQQSAVGRQQGEIGKAMTKRVSDMIDSCLKNNTCPAVS